MSVRMEHGIGYSARSRAMYIDMAAANNLMMPAGPIQPTMTTEQINARPWSPWGSNNMLADELVLEIKNTPYLNAIIEGQARLAFCNGVVPVITKIDSATGVKMIDRYVDDAEILDVLEANNHNMQEFGWAKDIVGFNRGIGRIVLNVGRDKVALFQRDDITETRLAKKDSRGKINHVWYSGEWSKVKSEFDDIVFKKPLLDPRNPWLDLQKRIKGGDKTTDFSLMTTHPGWGEQYYPTPMWLPALKWIKIAQSVPEMKAAIYKNSMRAKLQVLILETYWEKNFQGFTSKTVDEQEAIRKKVYDEIDEYLVGAENAGKAIFTNAYRDREGNTYADVQFLEIKDSTKAGEYLPDSAAANSEISFAMLWNSAINGGTQKNNLYSENQGGSNVREASTLQVILHEMVRIHVRYFYRFMKYYNGWHVKHKGLDFIMPATILTTTDTGAGSKPVVPGGNQPKENGTDKNN